jgi:hypothetical protein
MRFAHLKTYHKFESMRLRGLSGARDEFRLAAIVQNLKTMALRAIGPPFKRMAQSTARLTRIPAAQDLQALRSAAEAPTA